MVKPLKSKITGPEVHVMHVAVGADPMFAVNWYVPAPYEPQALIAVAFDGAAGNGVTLPHCDWSYCAAPPAAAPHPAFPVLAGEIAKESAWKAVCAGELESITSIVTDEVSDVLGVPPICPALLSVSPVGKLPELIVQE
jgi:hypothetical protein